ncbi:MAG: hypothetical protein IJI10_03395 [Eubacterium sp.]|nr:hypothetical protein [Eubacterium sp.]
MIPSIKYKSKLASLISGLGTVLAVIGVFLFVGADKFQEAMDAKRAEMIGGIGAILLIAGLIVIGVVYMTMKKKSYEKMIQYIKEKNLEPAISSSVDNALAVYKACPGTKMEKYIAALNPEAGAFIKKNRNKLK